MRTLALGVLALAACGRIGFGPTSSSSDAPDGSDVPGDISGDAVPFVEPIGAGDPTFGNLGITVLSVTGMDFRMFDVAARSGGGYLAFGIHATSTNGYMGMFAYTAAGNLDATFGTNGIRNLGPTGNDFAYAMARFGQRFVLVGDGDDGLGTNDDVTVALVDDTGTLDPTFGAAGYRRFDLQGNLNDTSEGVVVIGSEIVTCSVAAYDLTNSHVALVRMTSTGALVPSWGTGGLVIDDYSPSQQDECDDITTVGGRVITVGTSGMRMVIAGYTATGARDPSFATNGYALFGTPFSQAYGVTIAEGDIVAVGESNGRGHVVRLSPDGVRRASFGTNGEVDVPGADALFNVIVQPNGKLLIAGESGAMGIVGRLLPNGAPDTTFGANGIVTLAIGPNFTFQGLMQEPGGKILAVGTSGTATPRTGVIMRLD